MVLRLEANLLRITFPNMLAIDFSIHQITQELIAFLVLIHTPNIALNQFTLFLHYFVDVVVQFMFAAFLRCQFSIVILAFR